ncbi:hypothetical protein BVX97_01195 [bacterium E08(2017)]|nr:hypothetical protein BVX97_01195 [bacterium E08(2017)]
MQGGYFEMIARRQRKDHARAIDDELQHSNHSKETIARRGAKIFALRGVPRVVTDRTGMPPLARLAERPKSAATWRMRFGQHALNT